MKARAGCILLILLAVAGPADAQGKPEKERIRIGHAARVVSHSIPYLAAQAGLFREEGVQVEVVQATLNHLAERDARFAQRKPAEFIEPGPLSELDRSGFIERLYAGQK
jgi:ABC-type nitrate/sulfonate/bicarbonate transport system substrate-binding protein